MKRNLIISLIFFFSFTSLVNGAHHGTIKHLNSGAVLPNNLPFSEIVIAGSMIFLSGQIGNIPKTLDLAPGGLEGQSRQVMENIKLSLETNGFSLKNLTKCTVMLEDISQWSTFNNIYKSYFEAGKFPARTSLGVDGLALGALVEVECIGMR